MFDALGEDLKPSEKSQCFNCLEELCKKPNVAPHLSAFAELFIVRVTDVQNSTTSRDVSKAAENCGMAISAIFPPDTLVRALCPIVQNREFPVNQVLSLVQRLILCFFCTIN